MMIKNSLQIHFDRTIIKYAAPVIGYRSMRAFGMSHSHNGNIIYSRHVYNYTYIEWYSYYEDCIRDVVENAVRVTFANTLSPVPAIG